MSSFNLNRNNLSYELDRRYKHKSYIWSKNDLINLGISLEEARNWLLEWEKIGRIKFINNGNDEIFEVLKLSYRKKDMLAAGINRYYGEGDRKSWTKSDIIKHNLSIDEVTPWLKEWEAKGFIKFIGKDDEFFNVLKPIKED